MDDRILKVAITGDNYLRKLTNDFAHSNINVHRADLDVLAVKGLRELFQEGESRGGKS